MNTAQPLNALPDDVLEAIFIACLPSNPWCTTSSPTAAPVLLTRVCRRWRALVIALPRLWTTLTVEDLICQESERAEALPHYPISLFERAKELPVNLCINLQRVTAPSSFTSVHQLTAPVGNHLTRLVLIENYYCRFPASPVTTQVSFPKLESLGFVSSASTACNKNLLRFIDAVIASSPALCRIAIDLHRAETHSILPLHQITHYRYTGFITGSLSRCLRLKWLGVILMDIGQDSPSEDVCYPNDHLELAVPLDMPNIKSLSMIHVTNKGGEAARVLPYPKLFHSYSFPNLRTLRISQNCQFIEDDLNLLDARFIAKLETFTNLQYLSLHLRKKTSLRMLETLFDALPTVQTLHFCRDSGYDDVFSLLSVRQVHEGEKREGLSMTASPHRFLPKLRTLCLRNTKVWINSGNEGCKIPVDTIRPEYGFDAFLKSWVQLCPPERRLERLIVYGEAEDVHEKLDFVQCAGKYEAGGLIFERKARKKSLQDASVWMGLDPETRGWEEGAFIDNGIVQDDDV
ncbi:hypothetical protein NMY22_g5105 [Coprinellus aureogranulatus]|nr:hypothetical protein NMY22_g5105 [Coprinellus aureogranulatus]